MNKRAKRPADSEGLWLNFLVIKYRIGEIHR